MPRHSKTPNQPLDIVAQAALDWGLAAPSTARHKRLRCVCPDCHYIAYVAPLLIAERGPPRCPDGDLMEPIDAQPRSRTLALGEVEGLEDLGVDGVEWPPELDIKTEDIEG